MTLTRDDFEVWLIEMDKRLAELSRLVPKDVASKLNFSLASLSVIESWLLKKYPDINSLLQKSETRRLDCLVSYVGETIRRFTGAKWSISLSDPGDVFFQMPVVEKEKEWSESPGTLLTAALDRRTGRYMKSVISAYKHS